MYWASDHNNKLDYKKTLTNIHTTQSKTHTHNMYGWMYTTHIVCTLLHIKSFDAKLASEQKRKTARKQQQQNEIESHALSIELYFVFVFSLHSLRTVSVSPSAGKIVKSAHTKIHHLILFCDLFSHSYNLLQVLLFSSHYYGLFFLAVPMEWSFSTFHQTFMANEFYCSLEQCSMLTVIFIFYIQS